MLSQLRQRVRTMERLAVIDFETANHQPGSACQLGIVVVEPWRIIAEHQWLIRPQRLYFSPRCIQVHGITPRDVMDAPTWDRIWSEISEILDGTVVVAHNAGFDANVLSSTCQVYDLAIPPLDLQCTRLVSKRAWPGWSSHALANVARELAIEFRHHDALEDARASAKILMLAAQKLGVDSLAELEDDLGILRGRIWSDRVRNPRTIRRSRLDSVREPEPRYEAKQFRNDGAPMRGPTTRIARSRADEILASAQQAKPLEGKHVVLLNSLLGLERDDAIGFLTQLGAVVQPKINLQTHFVILGAPTTNDPLSESMTQAPSPPPEVERRKEDGQPIRVLTQRQLLAMIPSGLAIARGDG